jgi:hypothetical protein
MYEIKVKEILDGHWSQWFEGMRLESRGETETRQDYTLIIAPIADQPALHGLLAKIRDLNLTLISVRELGPKEPGAQERSQNDASAEASEKEHL